MIQGVNSSNSPAPLKKKKKDEVLQLIADVWNKVCAGRQLSLFGPTGADPPGLSIRAGALHQLQLWSLQVSQSGFFFFYGRLSHSFRILSLLSTTALHQFCIMILACFFRRVLQGDTQTEGVFVSNLGRGSVSSYFTGLVLCPV